MDDTCAIDTPAGGDLRKCKQQMREVQADIVAVFKVVEQRGWLPKEGWSFCK
jgi:hypothetical protein